jgi:hypothetical protein
MTYGRSSRQRRKEQDLALPLAATQVDLETNAHQLMMALTRRED